MLLLHLFLVSWCCQVVRDHGVYTSAPEWVQNRWYAKNCYQDSDVVSGTCTEGKLVLCSFIRFFEIVSKYEINISIYVLYHVYFYQKGIR